MLRFTFLMLVAVSFRPRFIITLKRSTFLPFRSAKMGHEADYPIWFAHGRAASCWLFLTTAETRQGRPFKDTQAGLTRRRTLAKSRR
jgi:hypothetical protein